MNERIKQLAEQARNYALDEKRIYERVHNTEQCMEVYRERYNEKFAELIVLECAQEAYDCAKQFRNDEHYRADNLWPHFESVCNAVGDDIKIKFGVEE